MTVKNRWSVVALLSIAVVVPARGAAAQQYPTGAAALEACAAFAEGDKRREALAAADQADRLFAAERSAAPDAAAPRIGLARVISQCRIPYANLLSAGRLIARSNELLEEALRRDARSWEGRFVLAMNHYHTPAFLGRTGDAIRELETLLAQQGDATQSPAFANTFTYLGDLYARTGRRDDAVRLWERGATLFPADSALRARLQSTERSTTAEMPAVQLAAVTVEGRRRPADETLPGVALNRLEVVTAPGGTADLLHGIRMQGGVTPATEGSDLYVRGGDPAEAPVWMDGGRLFYPGTFESLHGGLFGVLDPAVLSEAYFSSGGFSARYGNALSGVLDVRTEGRPAQARASVGVSLAGGSATAFLPVGPRGGGWAHVRATDATLLTHMQGVADEFTGSPRSLEGTAGFSYEPNARTAIRVTGLMQGDRATRHVSSNGHDGPFRSTGATRHLVVSGQSLRESGALLRTSLSGSERSNGYRFGLLDWNSRDRSLSATARAELPVGAATLAGGVEATAMERRQDGWVPAGETVANGAPAVALERREETAHVGGFLEIDTPLGRALSLVTGVRADRLPGETEWTLDPRAALAYRAGDWSLRLGGGVFHQGRWRVGYGIPDAGAPAGTPRRARHLALGLERGGERGIRVELYRKEYDRYVEAGEGPQITGGTALGADALARWVAGDLLSGWVTYSFLRGRVALADGGVAPSSVDVTHGVTAVSRLSLGSSLELGVTARYATGRPYTEVVAGSARGPVHGAPNAARLPDYRRLDARLTHLGSVRGRSTVTYVEVLNALDRTNVMGYTYGADYRERHPIESFFAHRVAVLGVEVQLR